MAQKYLRSYKDAVEAIPMELQHGLTQLYELDKRAQNLLQQIDANVQALVNLWQNADETERNARVAEVFLLQKECQEVTEDKIVLSNRIYNSVDEHIQNLDADLAEYENDILEQSTNQDLGFKAPPGKHLRKDKLRQPSPMYRQTATELNLRANPNEPLYCICQTVSHGSMVCCDNPDCLIEWYHFACVGLEDTPKGTWYCARCLSHAKIDVAEDTDFE